MVSFETKSRVIRLVQMLSFLSVLLFFVSLLFIRSMFAIFFLITAAIILFSFLLYYVWLRGSEKRLLMLTSWEDMKKQTLYGILPKMQIDESFSLTENEKILFPLTPCFYSGRAPFSSNQTVRDVIVTNKRILLGFHTSFISINKESFGSANLWFSSTPNASAEDLLTKSITSAVSNVKIEEFAYKEAKEGDEAVGFLRLTYKRGPVNVDMDLYHPKSKQIYDYLSKSSK
jgi:hypothetical protein